MVFNVIKNDCFNVVKRIKAIDKHYSIAYDAVNKVFKLFYKDTYQLTFPYNVLDERTFLWVYQTLNKNFERLSNFLDDQNLDLQNSLIVKTKSEIISNLESSLKLPIGDKK